MLSTPPWQPYDADNCAAVTQLVVTPPSETKTLVLPLTNIAINQLCAEGDIAVSEVRKTEGR